MNALLLRLRNNVCVAIVVQMTLLQTANADCDFSPIDSKHPISDVIAIHGKSLNVIVYPRWTFQPQTDGTVRITEIGDAELLDFGQVITSIIASEAQIPRNDCDIYASIDNSNISVRSPTLTAHFDLSATKWACPGLHVPCPTWSKPLRMCYKRLAKTIVGKGSGWYEAYLTPAFMGSDIVINTSQNSGFNLSQGTLATLGILFGPLVPIAANLAVANTRLNFPYPPIVLPASELEPGETSTSIQLNWINKNVYFALMERRNAAGSKYQSIDLVRERYLDQRRHTACFMHKTLGAL